MPAPRLPGTYPPGQGVPTTMAVRSCASEQAHGHLAAKDQGSEGRRGGRIWPISRLAR